MAIPRLFGDNGVVQRMTLIWLIVAVVLTAASAVMHRFSFRNATSCSGDALWQAPSEPRSAPVLVQAAYAERPRLLRVQAVPGGVEDKGDMADSEDMHKHQNNQTDDSGATATPGDRKDDRPCFGGSHTHIDLGFTVLVPAFSWLGFGVLLASDIKRYRKRAKRERRRLRRALSGHTPRDSAARSSRSLQTREERETMTQPLASKATETVP